MMTKKPLYRLGIFVSIAFLGFFIGILSLGERKGWFEKTMAIYVLFTDVDGLENGAPVRISGINAGKVASIRPPTKVGDRVMVRMEVEVSYKNLLREDAVAHIETEGLVGYKLVVIDPGSTASKQVEENGFIQSTEPVKLSDITKKFANASENIASIVRNVDAIADSIQRGKGTIGRLIYDQSLYKNFSSAAISVDSAFSSFSKQSREISSIFGQISTTSKQIMDKINRGEGTIGKLVTSDSLYNDIRSSTTNFVQVISKLEDGVYSFSENMEALKRNWFFKGYFEDRGYWSREDFTRVDQYLTKRKLELEQLQTDLQQQLDILKQREQALRDKENELKSKEK